MSKVIRYAIIIIVVVVGISVLRGVNGAFKGGSGTFVLGAGISVPGFESPPEFVKNITGAANSIIGNAVNGVTNSISQKVSETLENKATEEVTKNFQKLNDTEKEILKKSICQ